MNQVKIRRNTLHLQIRLRRKRERDAYKDGKQYRPDLHISGFVGIAKMILPIKSSHQNTPIFWIIIIEPVSKMLNPAKIDATILNQRPTSLANINKNIRLT